MGYVWPKCTTLNFVCLSSPDIVCFCFPDARVSILCGQLPILHSCVRHLLPIYRQASSDSQSACATCSGVVSLFTDHPQPDICRCGSSGHRPILASEPLQTDS